MNLLLECYNRWKENETDETSKSLVEAMCTEFKNENEKSLYCMLQENRIPISILSLLHRERLFTDIERMKNRSVLWKPKMCDTDKLPKDFPKVSGPIDSSILEDCGERHDLAELLQWYCTANGISYKLGMVNIMEPFLKYVEWNKKELYCSFTELASLYFSKFTAVSTELDKSNAVKELGWRSELVKHLLYYHFPCFASQLEQKNVGWKNEVRWLQSSGLSTLQELEPKTLAMIMDYYFALQDPEFSLFIYVALLLHGQKKDGTIDEKFRVSKVLNSEKFENTKFVHRILEDAIGFYINTPPSYSWRLQTKNRIASEESIFMSFQNTTSKPKIVDMSEWNKRESTTLTGKFYWVHKPSGKSQWEHPGAEFEPIPEMFCLGLNAESVAERVLGYSFKLICKRKYFIVDCRAFRNSEDVCAGKVPSAFTLDPATFEDPDLIQKAKDTLLPLSSFANICLLGRGIGIPATLANTDELKSAVREAVRLDIAAINKAALFLQKLGFPYVSYIIGGYSAWHAAIRDSQKWSMDDLIGHDSAKCKFCKFDAMVNNESTFGRRDSKLIRALSANFNPTNTTPTSNIDNFGAPLFDSNELFTLDCSDDEGSISDDEEIEIILPEIQKDMLRLDSTKGS